MQRATQDGPYLAPDAHELPAAPVIQRWVGDAVYADAGMDGRFAGARAFLVCGGPSLASVDVRAMRDTGSLIFAVNNAGAYPGVRPHFWTCVDDPKHFHQNVWLDPGICKLVSMTHAGRELRRKEGESFASLGKLVWQCPNVLFYERNVHFEADRYLPQPTVNWGCADKVICSEGVPGVRSVMLAALKLLAVLGVKEIYLVGADFHMEEERPYAWAQEKRPVYGEDGNPKSDPVGSNNRTYRVLARRLAALAPNLSRAGISVFNATEGSHLDVFPSLPYHQAIQRASVGLQHPPDLSGWYEA